MSPQTLGELPPLDFSGKTVLVTGTTNGLGLGFTEELMRSRVSTLIMGVRSVTRGEELKARLLASPEFAAGNPEAVIHVLKLDMQDFKSIVEFSDQVKALTRTVDIALLNAGTGGMKFEIAKTGYEKLMQVNVLANALLALELLPILEETALAKSSPSRLSWVGSFVQMDHTLDKKPIKENETVLGHFNDKATFSGMTQYPDTKLISTMFVQELAQHVDRKSVIFNEVSPGPVLTNFGAAYPFILRLVFKVLLASKARSLPEAVKTYLYAIAVAGEDSHGQYLSDNKITK